MFCSLLVSINHIHYLANSTPERCCFVSFSRNRKQTKSVTTRAVLTRTSQLIGTTALAVVFQITQILNNPHTYWHSAVVFVTHEYTNA